MPPSLPNPKPVLCFLRGIDVTHWHCLLLPLLCRRWRMYPLPTWYLRTRLRLPSGCGFCLRRRYTRDASAHRCAFSACDWHLAYLLHRAVLVCAGGKDDACSSSVLRLFLLPATNCHYLTAVVSRYTLLWVLRTVCAFAAARAAAYFAIRGFVGWFPVRFTRTMDSYTTRGLFFVPVFVGMLFTSFIPPHACCLLMFRLPMLLFSLPASWRLRSSRTVASCC